MTKTAAVKRPTTEFKVVADNLKPLRNVRVQQEQERDPFEHVKREQQMRQLGCR